MKKGFTLISLAFALCVFAFDSLAQSSLKNGEIPDDLLITVKRQEGWGGALSEMTINAKGEFSYKTSGGLPIAAMPQVLLLNGKHLKPPKYLKAQLSMQKLRLLVAEFEKIQFFKFGKDFPREDEKQTSFLTDQGTETISIRIDGQTKEVSNYLGEFSKRSKLLRNLAVKIQGAGIWNYENDEIPQNFQVWYRTTDGKMIYDYKIESNGKVIESLFSIHDYRMKNGRFGTVLAKPKTAGKFSKQQIRQLINEFERAGFSAFRYSPLSQYDGCSNAPILNAEKRTHINVQINRVEQMYVSLYENCNPKPETNAAKFEYMNTVIKNLLKTVEKKR